MRAILMYHSIDDTGSPVSVSPGVFREHVRWMSQSGVRVLPLDQLLAPGSDDARTTVAVTFDDGFSNFMDAAQLLIDAGLPVTVFPVSGHVGTTNSWNGPRAGIPTLPLLGWRDLERLASRGVAVGAHTRTHPALPSIPPAAVADEIDRCVEEIGMRLGHRPSSFAYPYGALNAGVEAAVAARFQAALTTRFSPLSAADRRSNLPRLDMYYFRRPGAIGRWGTPGFGSWVRWVHVRRTVRETLATG